MKKVLFLLDELPPGKSANGICVDKVIKSLKENEVDSVCICWNAPSNYICDVRIIPDKPWNRLVKKHSFSSFFGSLFFFCLRIIYKIKRIFLIPIWPVDSLWTANKFYMESVKAIETGKISTVVSVSYPGETLLAMKRLKKRYGNKIKTVMYPLDVSFVNPNCGRIEKWFSRIFSPIFMKQCSNYADVLLVLENAEAAYNKVFPENKRGNFSLCGIPLLGTVADCHKKKGQDIHFLYTGTFCSGVRDSNFVISALKELSSQLPNKLVFDFCGKSSIESDVESKNDNFIFLNHGWLDETSLLKYMDASDILVSIGNKEGNLIPSKLFKYMSTGKPIIHFCFLEDDPCLYYLKKYGNAYVVFAYKTADTSNNVEEELLNFIINRKTINKNLKQIFPRCFPEYTALILKKIVSES